MAVNGVEEGSCIAEMIFFPVTDQEAVSATVWERNMASQGEFESPLIKFPPFASSSVTHAVY